MLKTIEKATLEITNRCDLHCRICRIWQEKPLHHIPLASIKRAVTSLPRLTSVALTGGEPCLHPDIDRIYRFLCARAFKGRLKNIDIATNAYSIGLVKFLLRQRKFLRPLSLSISLDGTSNIHDAQRGTPGAFAATLAHVKAARNLGVPVLLKFTASAINYKDLPRVAAIASELKCPLAFKAAEELPAYYHRQEGARLPLLNKGQRLELLRILKGKACASLWDADNMMWHQKFLRTGRLGFIKGCQTPARALFITSREDVYNCLYQPRIATLAAFPETIDTARSQANIKAGQAGKCPQCLAYHGALQHFNINTPGQGAAATR